MIEGDVSAEEFRRAKAFLTGNWVFNYLTSDQVKTEAGPFVTPPSLQMAHKNERLWLEK